ncbi:MAG: peptidase S10 [Planctomycetota bacterium]|jgi:carboxypeptidase C (cathepsin A)|nr:peptidase S10 [Planctomycetota bacterium]
MTPMNFVRLLIIVTVLIAGSVGQRFTRADEPVEPADKPAAKDSNAKAARVPDATEKPVVTVHSIEAGGARISYAAETGMLPLLKDDGAAKASMFYVAYTKEGGDASRPIMFCFNGGPGASAVWLHLGGLGPRRARVNPDATLPPPPYELIDNAHTLLPYTDLVFIDPVATGYSRAAKDEKAEQFFGQDPDIEAMAEFIVLYTTRHRRWRSPKYLCGESYGVFRAAGIAEHLQDRHGMFLNGLLLVSGLVDFGTIRSGPSNDLPYAIFLPALTAVAHFHGRLPADLQPDVEQAMAEARRFASGEYLPALFAGDSLAEERCRDVAAMLARLTGLPQDLIIEHRLRIDPSVFRKELLIDQGLICGRFDGRITGRDGDRASSYPGFDPSYEAALGPLAATMNAYVREELGFENDLPYKVLTGVGPWKFDENTYASTARDLARAMSRNPHLRVLVMTGRCDLAVPPDSMRYSVDHLEIAGELRANVSYADYASGHMMYLNLPDLEKMAGDVAAFLGKGGQ